MWDCSAVCLVCASWLSCAGHSRLSGTWSFTRSRNARRMIGFEDRKGIPRNGGRDQIGMRSILSNRTRLNVRQPERKQFPARPDKGWNIGRSVVDHVRNQTKRRNCALIPGGWGRSPRIWQKERGVLAATGGIHRRLGTPAPIAGASAPRSYTH